MTKVEVLPIEQGATPDPQNVNKHTQRGRGLHENSMRKRGAGRSIFSAGKGVEIPVVMGGNQTLEIAASLGMEIINVHTNGNQIVNVVRDDIAPNSPEFFALGIEDNEIGKQSYSADIDQLALLAAADNSVLAETRRQDKIFGDMLAGMGVKGEEPVDAEPQIDRAAELAEKWQTSTGQLWKLGDHRLLIGDCTVRENVERLMGGERAVMMFTDPPYNFQTEGGGALHQQYAKTAERIADIVDFDPSPFLEILPTFFTERICAYVFCNKDLLPEYLVWAKSKKISFNLLVWKKPVSVPFGDSHRPDIEYLLLFRKGAKWNNGLQGVSYSRLLEYDNQRSDLHPTIKPLELVENQMKITSDKSDIIAEPFAGSGTTIIAAQNLSRRCYACEISDKYGAVILERFYTATGITPELVE